MSQALIIIFMIVTNLVLLTTSNASSNISADIIFIKKSCEPAVYPNLCVKSLTPYASLFEKKKTARQLVKLLLAVSLKTTNEAHKQVSQQFHTLAKSLPLKPCVDQLGSSVEKLSASLYKLKNTGTPKAGGVYMARLNTVSEEIDYALSYMKDCKDSLADPFIAGPRSMLKEIVNKADKTTSNALTLCNTLINSNSKP